MTGIRQLFLGHTSLKQYFSFENTEQIFDIHRSFKFATIVAEVNYNESNTFEAAFYLHNDAWLFTKEQQGKLTYDKRFVEKTGGEYLSFLEIKNQIDLQIASIIFAAGKKLGDICKELNVITSVQADMTRDSGRFDRTELFIGALDDPRKGEVAEVLLSDKKLRLIGKFRCFPQQWGYTIELKRCQ